VTGRNKSNKNFNDNFGSRNSYLPVCRAEPQPTVPLRAPCNCVRTELFPEKYNSNQPDSFFTEFQATVRVSLSSTEIQFYRTDCDNGVITKMCFVMFVFWYSVKNNCKCKDGCETGNGSLKCLKMYCQIS
jgi:hypothetical protein